MDFRQNKSTFYDSWKEALPQLPSGLRRHFLAEQFSQVAEVVQTLMWQNLLLSENFNLWHATKTNKWQDPAFPILWICFKCNWANESMNGKGCKTFFDS